MGGGLVNFVRNIQSDAFASWHGSSFPILRTGDISQELEQYMWHASNSHSFKGISKSWQEVHDYVLN